MKFVNNNLIGLNMTLVDLTVVRLGGFLRSGLRTVVLHLSSPGLGCLVFAGSQEKKFMWRHYNMKGILPWICLTVFGVFCFCVFSSPFSVFIEEFFHRVVHVSQGDVDFQVADQVLAQGFDVKTAQYGIRPGDSIRQRGVWDYEVKSGWNQISNCFRWWWWRLSWCDFFRGSFFRFWIWWWLGLMR